VGAAPAGECPRAITTRAINHRAITTRAINHRAINVRHRHDAIGVLLPSARCGTRFQQAMSPFNRWVRWRLGDVSV